jgi:hypothetical protein
MDHKIAVNYNFEWVPQKARDNRNKHGVAFDEAATVFSDAKALSIFDPDHSEFENRWITKGESGQRTPQRGYKDSRGHGMDRFGQSARFCGRRI